MNETSTIGLDLAKHVFQAHCADAGGNVVFRKQLRRDKVLAFLARQPVCLVAMEACASAHYWAREISKLGHTVRLIPPSYVKPFGEAFHAQVISYADDFVILSRGHAEEALTWTKAVMTKLGLTLNETKTSVKNARLESFDFLGYTLGPRRFRNGGRWYLGAAPSKKSVLRIKRKISELLTPGNKGAWPEVQARLNRLLRGWSAYFSYGSLATAHQAVDRHIFDRVLAFLRRRHKTPGRGVRRFSDQIYGNPGVLVLNRVRKVSPTCAL